MEVITSTLSGLTLGEAAAFRNLSVFPLLGGSAGAPDYLTLDEALSGKTARVTEVSASGSVPELLFANEGDRPVLLLDGDELIGAKQNRVLNLTILVGAQTTVKIPVSCVEAGRWRNTSVDFMASSHGHYAAGRAKKMAQVTRSLHTSNTRASDQGEVWADIEEKSRRMASHSPTQAMAAMYEQHEGSLEEYVAALSAQAGQAGALFAINGRVTGFDLFDYPATLATLMPKLVRSYALDSLDATGPAVPITAEDARAFLDRVAQAQAQTFPALGLGTDVRLDAAGATGAALLAGERVVHLSAFAMAGADAPAEPASAGTRMSRPSLRRFFGRSG